MSGLRPSDDKAFHAYHISRGLPTAHICKVCAAIRIASQEVKTPATPTGNGVVAESK